MNITQILGKKTIYGWALVGRASRTASPLGLPLSIFPENMSPKMTVLDVVSRHGQTKAIKFATDSSKALMAMKNGISSINSGIPIASPFEKGGLRGIFLRGPRILSYYGKCLINKPQAFRISSNDSMKVTSFKRSIAFIPYLATAPYGILKKNDSGGKAEGGKVSTIQAAFSWTGWLEYFWSSHAGLDRERLLLLERSLINGMSTGKKP